MLFKKSLKRIIKQSIVEHIVHDDFENRLRLVISAQCAYTNGRVEDLRRIEALQRDFRELVEISRNALALAKKASKKNHEKTK